jgi:hypothetical protein
MSKLSTVTGDDAIRKLFHCPGCEQTHVVPVTGPHAWGWNGSDDSPTFTPSILIHAIDPMWTDDNGKVHGHRCHTFVRDGNIQFLGDCTHSLANQTVPIPEWKGFA